MRKTCKDCLPILLVIAALALAGCTGGATGTAGGGASGVAARPALGSIDPAATRILVAEHPDVLLLDVRQPEELTGDLGQIQGIKHIPLPELPARLAEIEGWKDKTVVTVCRSGNRSRAAGDLLLQAGFKDVRNLEGGMAAWRRTEGSAKP